MKISVVITNWNGEKLLAANLLKTISASPEAYEFIVVDDGSTDGSVAYIKTLQKTNSKIRLVNHTTNQGFIHATNTGVQAARGDLVVLLNNDVLPQTGYLTCCLPLFARQDTFAVSFAEAEHFYPAKIFWSEGFFQHSPKTATIKPTISAWANGGSALFRKKYFIKLHGMDPMYSPFYWEDLDLGYRAWKSGYKIYWHPKATVLHKHESTISSFPKSYTQRARERNQLLFIWKNISDVKLKRSHLVGLVLRCLFGPNYCKVILSARARFRMYPRQKPHYLLSDREVMALFND